MELRSRSRAGGSSRGIRPDLLGFTCVIEFDENEMRSGGGQVLETTLDSVKQYQINDKRWFLDKLDIYLNSLGANEGPAGLDLTSSTSSAHHGRQAHHSS